MNKLVAAVAGRFWVGPLEVRDLVCGRIVVGSELNHVVPQCRKCVLKTDTSCTVREETVCLKLLKSLLKVDSM